MSTPIKGYKGFDKNFKCRDMQFEVGKKFEVKGDLIPCENGIHFCENPFDVWAHYDPTSRFAEVESLGKTAKHDDDSKVATNRLLIKTEINLNALIKAGVQFILDRVNWKDAKESNTGYRSAATNTGDWSAVTNTGDRSAATNTGYRSAATNTGYQSAATNTGDWSAATNTGYQSAATNTGDWSACTVEGIESVAASLGLEGKAKGAKGCWLVLAEWKYTDNWHREDVQCRIVDGVEIKADTFYQLKDGKFIEA